MAITDTRCPVCHAELEKRVYNNFADSYETVRNLIDIMRLDGGDNRRLNRVKKEAHQELVNTLFDEHGLKVTFEFVIYCMKKLREEAP